MSTSARPNETALQLAARARETLERCALRSQLRGDPMLGTAFPAARVLLVEQPGPWGRAGLRESRFDPAVAGQLETGLGRRGVRVLVIRRPGRTPAGQQRRWGFADCRPGHERLVWGRFDADDELLGIDPDRLAEHQADPEPMFGVCAHSRHDTCCALRGRPVAAALDEVRPGRAWECSHVGGERFAANVLVLPLGLQYGRVLAFAAGEFADAAAAGMVIPALLRGRIGLTPVAQAGLAYAHSQLAIARSGAIRVRGVREPNQAQALVRLATPHGLMDVTVEIEQRRASQLTCSVAQPGTFVAYRPGRIAPAPMLADDGDAQNRF